MYSLSVMHFEKMLLLMNEPVNLTNFHTEDSDKSLNNLNNLQWKF